MSEVEDVTLARANVITHRVSTLKLSNPTPRLTCKIDPPHGSSFEFQVLPDTGATVSVMALDLVQRMGMTIVPSKSVKLLSASDEQLQVSGSTRFKINGIWIQAIVLSSISEDCLIGWRDLTRLGVIEEDFPTLSPKYGCRRQ